MIFYFSGTGNSLWVAKELNAALGEPMISMASELLAGTDCSYSLQDNERVLFVFPVHSWGMPVPVADFVDKFILNGYNDQKIAMVCTCGDECGKLSVLFHKKLSKRGYKLTNSYSIQMPNNYFLLPGFDVDSKEVEAEKLRHAPALVAEVVESIKTDCPEPIYHKGSWANLKSYMIYPLFKKYALTTKPFTANDLCISCGLCKKICPTKTIFLENARPKWETNGCVQCLACINVCPTRAIEYGKVSVKKGRYMHPGIAKI